MAQTIWQQQSTKAESREGTSKEDKSHEIYYFYLDQVKL